MRKKSEIQAEEQRLYDQLWYARHMILGVPEGTPDDIAAKAEATARRIESEYHPEHLEEIQHDVCEVGRLHGMLMALRWTLGMDWNDDGILDS
jgi:hypothetical protein